MLAEVIAIGDELTSGQRLDTNTRWISQQLGELGIRTVRHTTVGDDLSRNVDAMQLAVARADIVVITGGLGPTLDDLTRQAMADAFDCPLELDQASLDKIEAMFVSRNRPMPERNRIQAMFPLGSVPIPNPHGSAPGIDLSVASSRGSVRLFALPGVPAEMKQMWAETVVPRIEMQNAESLAGDYMGPMRFHAVKVFGIGESDVEVRLPTLIERNRNPSVGITVSRATITLRIAGRAATAEGFRSLIEPTIQEIDDALGDLVFGSDADELQHTVARQLQDRGKTMASIEVGAASWIGDWMLAVAEDFDGCFSASVAFPELAGVRRWLEGNNAGQSLTEVDDAVESDRHLLGLASEVRRRLGVDFVLLTGRYPTPNEMANADSPFQPYFVVVSETESKISRKSMGGHPDVLGPRIAKTGLDLVRRVLLGLPVS